MGSPKFSLDEALKVLRPHLEHLSFQDISLLTGVNTGDFKDKIGNQTYSFSLWASRITVPASLSSKAMVHVIPVSRFVTPQNGSCRVANVTYTRLLLERNKTDSFRGRWLFQLTSFVPASKDAVPAFYLSNGTITYVDDDIFDETVYPPKDFPEKFWSNILGWVSSSMEVRMKALESLKLISLKAQCAIDARVPVSEV